MLANANVNVTAASPHVHTARAVPGWEGPRHIGLLNDFVHVPYANGSSFAAQFLHREFRARGHRVTVVGPSDPAASPADLPINHVALPSVPLRVHPGVRLALPGPSALRSLAERRVDLVLGQTATGLAQAGVWLRAMHSVPFLCVNTVHLPSVYNVLLSDRLLAMPGVDAIFRDGLVPYVERYSTEVYNRTDGLIVLSRGLLEYWRARGVTAPIHVIARSVEPKIFDRPALRDPFPLEARPGARLLCVCRHIREKALDRLIRLFARHIGPCLPEATLTLIGDGPEHDALRAQANALGVAQRVFFPGELPSTELPSYYRSADLFLYASQSETYGQVVSEALWCGLPVVALADGMGVSDQVEHERTGILIAPERDGEATERELAAQSVRLLLQHGHRRALAQQARERTRARVHPSRILDQHYAAFEQARQHCAATTRGRAQPHEAAAALRRWTAIHAALAALGCLRAETTVNRNHRRPSGWHDFERVAPRAVSRDPGPLLGMVSALGFPAK